MSMGVHRRMLKPAGSLASRPPVCLVAHLVLPRILAAYWPWIGRGELRKEL